MQNKVLVNQAMGKPYDFLYLFFLSTIHMAA